MFVSSPNMDLYLRRLEVCAREELAHALRSGIDFAPALEAAAGLGRGHVVELLLGAGLAQHARGHVLSNALIAASAINNTPIMDVLLTHGANPCHDNSCALAMAAEYGHVDAVVLLLRAGANANACRIHTMLPTPHSSALVLAIVRGHVHIVQLLLHAGANPNGGHGAALMYAVRIKRIDMVRLLLAQGADPTIQDSIALQEASMDQNQEIFDLLYPISNAQAAWQAMLCAPYQQQMWKMLEERLCAEQQKKELCAHIGTHKIVAEQTAKKI